MPINMYSYYSNSHTSEVGQCLIKARGLKLSAHPGHLEGSCPHVCTQAPVPDHANQSGFGVGSRTNLRTGQYADKVGNSEYELD